MRDTRNEIIRLANELIRSVGYNAFSYADIANELKIKNAAIHYHFPSKTDLGVEVIKENTLLFLRKVDSWKDQTVIKQLENYTKFHDPFCKRHWVCIVGSLSPAYDTLPPSMQNELKSLIEIILDWLTQLLTKGKEKAEFTFQETPKDKAYLIHAAVLSSLLMNKVLKNDIYKRIQQSLLVI